MVRKGENMSNFYTAIAKYYDDIFPTGEAQLQLIKETAGTPPKDILDVACGSGGYSKRLSDMGYSVTAIDLDPQMIQSLKEKDSKINSHVLNMLNMDDLPGTFDLIFCIGNSLVHLSSLDEIKAFLVSCRNKLKPHGRLILQIINYDRILEKGVKQLPTIKNEERHLTFERYYSYSSVKHSIDFKTLLTVDNQVFENHVPLYPLRTIELRELLDGSGFTQSAFYGSFRKDKYEPLESYSLVVISE